MKTLILSIWTILAISSAYALETDNYYAWTVELEDSREKINQYINEQIQLTLEEINKKKPHRYSCKRTTIKIAKRFKTRPPFDHPLEDWLKENLDESYVFPKNKNYREESVYQDRFRFYLKYVHLAPTMQVNGYYFGTDKLSHFVSTGRRYFKHYLKKLKKGMEPKKAVESSIRFGLLNEKTFLGTWSSGVFSYGDMEANYQGLNFYLKFCSLEENNYLQRDEEKKWVQVEKVDIGNYINPYWDETFYTSYRIKNNWKKTGPMIKKLMCPLLDSEIVKNRFAHYEAANHNSFSIEYLKQLQDEKYWLAPIPQTDAYLSNLCE